MSDTLLLVLISIFGLAAFIVLMVFIFRRNNDGAAKNQKSKGRDFAREKAVSAARSFASSNSFRFIAPARLSRSGGTANIDAIVVGYFGVLGVISLGYGGQVYGDAGEDTWLQVGGDGSRTRFESPASEAAAAVRAIRDALFAGKMKKVPVEVVCVFVNPDVQLAVPRSMAPMRLKAFKTSLKDDRFLQDKGLSLDDVEATLRAALAPEEKK